MERVDLSHPSAPTFLPSAPLAAQSGRISTLLFDAGAGTLEGFIDNVSFGTATGQTNGTFRSHLTFLRLSRRPRAVDAR